MTAVNADFAIFTRSGTLLYQFSGKDWFADTPGVGSNGVYDPQIIYDSVAGRWVLLYLVTDKKTLSWVGMSVSDTSDPTGQWCNWSIPGDENGDTASGNWADFPGLAFDSQALYLTTNQYAYDPQGKGAFEYARIRILKKSDVYGPCSGGLGYYDFWNVTDPGFSSAHPGTLRPAVTFGTPGVEYLVNNSPFETSTYLTLWSLTNPLSGSPRLSGRNVPVTASADPPNADQRGGTGGTSDCPAPCLIDTSNARLLNAVYRDGSLWTAHAVADSSGVFSRARYVRLDVRAVPRVLEDLALGVDGCWYYYPAVAVDQSSNFAMVFSRSCIDEYAGIRYAARAASDTDLQSSVLLKQGQANYLKSFEGRNRWGDYSGAAIDPTDSKTIWLVGEYAATPIDKWGTWVDHIVVAANPGTPPIASYVYQPQSPQASKAIQFSDQSTGSPSSWSWDFGDHTGSSLQSPTKTFPSPGTYTVTLTVGNSFGSNSTSQRVTVGECFRCTRTLPPRATVNSRPRSAEPQP